MPAPIEQLISALEAYAPLAAIPDISFGFGVPDVRQHSKAPRVVWIPVQGSIGPIRGPRGPGGKQRALYTRTLTIEAHIWGESLEQADALLNEVSRAIYSVGSPSVRPVSEIWPLETTAHLASGFALRLRFEVDIPITDQVTPVTQPSGLALQAPSGGGTPGDGILDYGES